MSEPFIGEIRMFAGNFAPRGWALCNGQLLAVAQNDALFSLLGTIYGGDGRTTFALPDLRGRVPVHYGTGPGLSPRRIGEKAGVERVTLTTAQLPPHTHPQGAATPAGNTSPIGKLHGDTGTTTLYAAGAGASQMHASASQAVGGGQPHDNLMPFTCVNFIIALFGIFPSRN